MSKDLEIISRRAIARLKLRDMQVFLMVNRFGSMAKAAQYLSLTQPAISQSIAEIKKCALMTRYYAEAENILKPEKIKTEFRIFEEINYILKTLDLKDIFSFIYRVIHPHLYFLTGRLLKYSKKK